MSVTGERNIIPGPDSSDMEMPSLRAALSVPRVREAFNKTNGLPWRGPGSDLTATAAVPRGRPPVKPWRTPLLIRSIARQRYPKPLSGHPRRS